MNLMNKNFNYVINSDMKKQADISFLNLDKAKEIMKYHESFPIYQQTPLQSLTSLAKESKVKNIFVKDESYRFNLNAFKVLGGSYAIGKLIAQKAGIADEMVSYQSLKEAKKAIGDLTFITATDGNHGRGIAYSANQLGYHSIVYMPKGSAIERRDNIRLENSECTITDLNYDDVVRYASEMANKNDWLLVQDTAWPDYEEIPTWIMQGYMTLAAETQLQLQEKQPTHIFLQAGVGSFAAAICGFFANVYHENLPKIIVIEPNTVDCLYQSANANDGKIHSVTGDLPTIMAGLACGEPSTVGWSILKDYAYAFVTCPDYAAADGMRILANPIGNDKRVISGESGAAPLGCIMNILNDKKLEKLKGDLGIDEDSTLLFINSEGDTDKENYQNIVWYGKYSKYEEDNHE